MEGHNRVEPPTLADERATLTSFLQFQRDTLELKCSGLSTTQLRKRAVPPSALSLLGLVRHLTVIERAWFRNVMDGEDSETFRSPTPDGRDDFDVDHADADRALADWHSECARSRAIVAAAGSLDNTGRHRDEVFSLRYVLTHMIEEYARHNGQADLLRERLDGSTGE